MASDGLTIADLCDAVYELWVERLERQYLADRQATMIRGDGEPPSWESELAKFDGWLRSDRPSEGDEVLSMLGLVA